MKYQTDYAAHFPVIIQAEHRQAKARKIVKALLHFIDRTDLAHLACLDMGCSAGFISAALENAGGKVTGVDIDYNAILDFHPPLTSALQFTVGDAGQAPFADSSFDIIVCSQVYEHVPDANLLFSELARLLKPKGVCYFSGPNRWALMEDHYHLPLLSWLPRPLSNLYVRLMRRGEEYYEKPQSAGALRHKLQNFFITDLTSLLLTEPERYEMGAHVKTLSPVFKRLPAWMWRWLGAWVPNFNWILTLPPK